MFLKILKSNQAYNLILFPLIAVILWSLSIAEPGIYIFSPGENQTALFYPLFNLLSENPLWQVIISLLLVIVLGFIVQKLNNQYTFYRVRTLLPSAVIILLISGISELHFLHPIYFAAVFLLFAIDRIFESFEKKSVKSNAIDAGFLLGIGSLFYTNLIFLFPALVLGMRIVNREFNWRGFILIFWGFILPWIFAFSYYYLTNRTNEIILVLKQNLLETNDRLWNDIPLEVYTGFWAFLLFIGSLLTIRQFDERKISARKYYSFYLLLELFIIGIFFFSPFASIEILVLLTIPSTFIISNLFLSMKNHFWSELIFVVLTGLIIFMQFI